MAIIRNLDIRILKAPAAIFGAKIETEPVRMDNVQAAHFVISTGEGAAAKAKVQVMAKYGDKDSVLVREEEISIGGNTDSKIVVAAREICKEEKNSVYLAISNANAPNIVGSIFVVKTNERYSTEAA